MKNDKKLKVWQRGLALVKATYEVVRQLSHEETYGLRSQLTRVAVSIPSNIAEGSNRTVRRNTVIFSKSRLAPASNWTRDLS